jgi:hypothetical protein
MFDSYSSSEIQTFFKREVVQLPLIPLYYSLPKENLTKVCHSSFRKHVTKSLRHL